MRAICETWTSASFPVMTSRILYRVPARLTTWYSLLNNLSLDAISTLPSLRRMGTRFQSLTYSPGMKMVSTWFWLNFSRLTASCFSRAAVSS